MVHEVLGHVDATVVTHDPQVGTNPEQDTFYGFHPNPGYDDWYGYFYGDFRGKQAQPELIQ